MTRSRRRRRVWVLTGLLVGAALGAYLVSATGDDPDPVAPSTRPSPQASITPSPSARPSAAPRPVVLAISVDGLNPEALTTLGRSGAPAFWRLIDDGASTLNARTAYELTITLPNHASMMTGRPVMGRSGTSVTFNDDNGGSLAATHGSYVPGMFDIAHDHGVDTALFAEKDKFAYLVRSWDRRHGARDRTGADDGTDKLDIETIAGSDQLVPAVVDAVSTPRPGLVFWHVAAPDVAGHASGWLSSDYLGAVRSADRQLGAVLSALDADPQLARRTSILLTADHGGPLGDRRHDDTRLLANYRIPFIAWGRGVRRGADLYALNDARTDPGTARPGYAGLQPVRNLDLADTALQLLGLPSIPGAPASDLEPLDLQ